MGEQNMTRQELIDYFKDVFELEKQVYTYERIQKEYDDKLKVTGVPVGFEIKYEPYGGGSYSLENGQYRYWKDEIITPMIRNVKTGKFIVKPEWKETKEFKEIWNAKASVKNPLFKILCLIIILIVCALLFNMIFIERVSFIDLIVGLIIFAIPIGLVACGAYLLLDKIYYSFSNFSNIEERKKKIANYYQRCAREESLRIAESEKPLRNHLENEYNELVLKPMEETKRLLDKLYSQNIIFDKYRNIVCVAQIYEYLASGRCEQLEGPFGAYNLYESELRQNIIINRLDQIILQLSTLNATMNTICGAIQTTNHLLGDISMTLGRIEANTSLIAYNSQCIAYNTNIANRYNY